MGIWSEIAIPPAQALNGVASSAADRQISLAAQRRVVPLTYGEDRVAGLILNVLNHATDPKLFIVQVLWGHAVDSINDLKLNDQDLPAGSPVTHYRGDQLTRDSEMFAAMQLQGISYTASLFGYAYSVIKIPVRAFTGQLNITGRIRGRRLYDPRKDSTNGGAGAHRLADPLTWEWSENAALAKADWSTNTLYGAGRPVLWSSVAGAANACDAMIGSGTQERRRIIGLTLNSAADIKPLAEAMRAYAGCWTIPTAGGIKLIPDADAAPVDDIEHASGDILSMSSLLIRDVGSAPTVVEVIYTDKTKVPYRDASAFATLPGAGTTRPYRLSQVRMPGVQRYSQALREATERLNKLTLADLTVTVDVADEGIKYQTADIVRLSHPVGLELKPMRVLNSVMVSPGRWRLALQEHDPAVYSSEVQTQASVPDTSFNNPAGPPAQVTGIAAAVSMLLITLTRTPTTDVGYNYTAWEYSTNGGGTYTPIPAAPINDGRTGSTWQTSVQGALRIRARDVDRDNIPGPWSLAYDFTVGPEILPAGGSATLGIKINQADFGSASGSNYNEAYIHGRAANGVAADIDGSIRVSGVAVTVPKGPLYTGMGPVSGVIVWDNGGAGFSTTVPAVRPYAMARKYNGQWQFDNNSGWVNFTPTSTHYVIGQIDTGAVDTGSTPPGILAALMLSDAQLLSSVTGESVGLNPGDALNQDPYCLDSSKWELSPGLSLTSPTTVAGAKGTSFISAPAGGGNDLYAWDSRQIPVDPGRAYNFSANLFTSAAGRNMYLVVRMVRADGREYGAVDLGAYPGFWGGGFAGYTYGGQTAAGVWTLVGADFGAGTPRPIPSDVAYLRVGVWFRYSDGSGSPNQAAQFIRLTDVTAAKAAGLTAVWTGVTNRPSTYRVGARGLSASGYPIGSDLVDADINASLVGGGAMYQVVKIHRLTRVVTNLGTFNPLSGAGGALAQCNAMAAVLNSIDSQHICVVFTYDEPATNRRTGDLPAAMYRNGASRAVWGSDAFQYRGAYILVGIGGCGEGNGAENYAGAVNSDVNAWCDTTFQITASGALVVSGAARGATSLLDYGYIGSNDATTNKFFQQETDPVVSPGGIQDGTFWRVPSTGYWYQRIAGTWRRSVEPGTVGTGEMAPGSATQLVRGFLLGPIASFNDA